jgi:hypothetical protein
VIGKIRKKDQDSNYSGPDNDKVFVPFSAMARDFPRTDAEAGVVSNIIVTPQPWVHRAAARGARTTAPAASRTSTGRSSARSPRAGAAPPLRSRDRNAIAMWDTTLQTLMFGRMIEHMKVFFTVVGVVTLSLGGLGVMNIMLVAVRERTREIGVRKALGATTGNVQRQFFLEGFILTMLSGSDRFRRRSGCVRSINLLPMPTRFSGMVITPAAGLAAVAALTVIGVITSTYPRAARRCCRRSRRCATKGIEPHEHAPPPRPSSGARRAARRSSSLQVLREIGREAFIGWRATACGRAVDARHLVGHRVGGDAAGLRRGLQSGDPARVQRRVRRRRLDRLRRPDQHAVGRRARRQAHPHAAGRRAKRSGQLPLVKSVEPEFFNRHRGLADEAGVVLARAVAPAYGHMRSQVPRSGASSTPRTCGCSGARCSSAARWR